MAALSPRAIPVTRRASALYCQTHGRGSPLLLIHDTGSTGAEFQALLPALAERYLVIVPDLRGHGESRRLAPTGNTARLAADLDDLLDLLGTRPAFVLGHAAGSVVARQLAHDHPERVRGLVLVRGRAGAGSLRQEISGRLQRRIGPLLGAASPPAVAARVGIDCTERQCQHPFDVPSLVVCGGADRTATPEQALELARRLAHAEMRVIPGADHRLVRTHPAALLDVALPWLAAQAEQREAA